MPAEAPGCAPTEESGELTVELVGVSVGPSMIAGHGVLADAGIAHGAVVVRFAAAPTSVDGLGPVNHSCDPDLAWLDATTLIAHRPIEAGTEVTLDYSTMLDDPQYVLWCHCETYRCRQAIEGNDWQIPQLQKRYAGMWTPHLRQRIESTGAAAVRSAETEPDTP